MTDPSSPDQHPGSVAGARGLPMVTEGLCRHCGRSDAPMDSEGHLDRHRRADWNRDVDPGNELCAAGGFGAYQRPGEACRHLGPNPYCQDRS